MTSRHEVNVLVCFFLQSFRVPTDCFLSTCPAGKSKGRCGSFFGSTAAVGDKYSRAVLGVDEAEKDWRLFDIWDRRFDKLPVISAKLSLRVTGADASGKARCLSDF
ncbi:hypothetical protein ACFX15_040041 [Malus domestica]